MVDIKDRILGLVRSGSLREARVECLSACEIDTKNAELWFILSAICGQEKDFSASEKYISKAIEINSTVPSAYYNLAMSQKAQNKIDEAIISLEKSLLLQENFVASIFELANIYLGKKEFTRSVDYYNKVISYAPDAFQAHTNIAIALEMSHDYEAGVTACLESLRINADQQDVVLRLAHLYDKREMTDEALTNYNRVIEFGNADADVFVNVGSIYNIKGDVETAKNYFEKALFVDSGNVEALTNLALIYESVGDIDIAIEYIEKANLQNSDDERFLYNRAKILASANRYSESKELYKKVIDKNPEFCEATVNLGNLYLLSGDAKAANELYLKAYETKPKYYEAISNTLMSMNYIEQYSAMEIRDMHFNLARTIEENNTRCVIEEHTKNAGELRIGYVSSDFRDHSVSYFLNDILKYSDKDSVANYCYSDVTNVDEVTKRLKSYVDHWQDVSELDNKELANVIRNDEIDVLIDLCGHTAGNRMPMFAMKPAKKQISYLGYPNTTGLKSIDHRIVDKITDPDGSENMMSEMPLYIDPCFLSYAPPFENEPSVTAPPVLSKEYITFGSFNNLGKISEQVIQAWSEILLAVPDSRLCIKSRLFTDDNVKSKFCERFEAAGIEENRLVMLGAVNKTYEHLQAYNDIDIALDTFPYNGTTTTIEALWMGVPVVCISGDRHASRVSASVMNVLGLDNLVSKDLKNYIAIACDLAKDYDKLTALRSDLRECMIDSPLLDGKAFTKKFETSLLSLSN